MESDKGKFGSANSSGRKGRVIQRSKPTARDVRSTAGLFLVCILLGFPGTSLYGGQKNENKVDFLIARRQVQDPYFEHSVVMMLPAPKDPLIVGIIINKPTRVTLGKLLPNSPEFKNRTDPAYFGGPVYVRIPSVIFRSSTVPEHALRLYGDVYLTFDADLIAKVYQNPQPDSKPRLFLGRAQWAPEQLTNEIQQGGWYKVQAEGNLVFSSQPESLWGALHARAAPSKYIRYQIPSGAPHWPMRKTSPICEGWEDLRYTSGPLACFAQFGLAIPLFAVL